MKKVLLAISLLALLSACDDKKEKSVEDSLKDAASNVNTQLKRLDNAAKKHTADFSSKVEEGSKDVGAKAEDALKKVDKKTTELLDSAAGKDKPE